MFDLKIQMFTYNLMILNIANAKTKQKTPQKHIFTNYWN